MINHIVQNISDFVSQFNFVVFCVAENVRLNINIMIHIMLMFKRTFSASQNTTMTIRSTLDM